MAGEAEAAEAIAAEHRRIGFSPAPGRPVRKLADVVAERVQAAMAKARPQLEAAAVAAGRTAGEAAVGAASRAVTATVNKWLEHERRAAAAHRASQEQPVSKKAEPVDLYRQWTGGADGTTLAKRTPAAAADDPEEALELVKLSHTVPTVEGGGLDVAKHATRIGLSKAVAAGAGRLEAARAAGCDVAPARIEEQRRLADALVDLPVERAPFTLPGSESPQFAAATAGAEELEAAAREAAVGAGGWLDRLNMQALAKGYRADRKRVHPHVVGRAGEA